MVIKATAATNPKLFRILFLNIWIRRTNFDILTMEKYYQVSQQKQQDTKLLITRAEYYRD